MRKEGNEGNEAAARYVETNERRQPAGRRRGDGGAAGAPGGSVLAASAPTCGAVTPCTAVAKVPPAGPPPLVKTHL